MKTNIGKTSVFSSFTNEVKKFDALNFYPNKEADLSDLEIDNICQGLTQNAAKIRHLIRMGLRVRRKPNGRALVNRVHYDLVTSHSSFQSTSNEPRWSTN